MHSTRGLSYKFSVGEKVLCYEPDPTKAKVLYESKVLDLVPGRDERGRKAPEYLIHFLGWNSSWDRCVQERFILAFTDENQELQEKLAEEASLSLRGKRKSKPLGKEVKKEDSPCSSSEEEDEAEAECSLTLPDVLKQLLEEDQHWIKKKDKVVRLPCVPTVSTILNDFLLSVEARKLAQENQINLYQETIEGLQNLFDASLGKILLYSQEMTNSPQEVIVKMEPPEHSAEMEKTEELPSQSKRRRGRSSDISLGMKTEEVDSQPRMKRGCVAKLEEVKSALNAQSLQKKKRGRPKSVPKPVLLSVPSCGSPPLEASVCPPPSRVYGARHLLRMLVKLPDMLSAMNLPNRKLKVLLEILGHFITYICENEKRLFPASAYIEK